MSKRGRKTQSKSEIAYQKLSAIMESGITFGWHDDDPRPNLAAMIASSANPERPDSMQHLAYLLNRLLPESFHSAARDWLDVISDKDLPGFFEGLIRSETDLSPYAEQLQTLRPDGRKKPLILQVDDDHALSELIKLVLSREFEEQALVVSVDFPPPALILASVLFPDLVLTDVSNVGLNGFEFAGYLKKDPMTQNLPFVFVTARAQNLDLHKGIQLGARDYITKPFSPHQLIASVVQVLGIEARHSSKQDL